MMRKKRKRRKKKLPKTSSSFLLCGSTVNHGNMHENAEYDFKDAVTTEDEQHADVLINTHTVVTYTLMLISLNSVHSKEVARYFGWDGTTPCMKEMGKLIEEKVIAGEEIILKNGMPALSLCSDRTHLYIAHSGRCWLDRWKHRHRYVWRLVCLSKTAKDLICLLFRRFFSFQASTWTSQRRLRPISPNDFARPQHR